MAEKRENTFEKTFKERVLLKIESIRMFLFQAQTENLGVTKSESVSFSISKN